MRNQITHLSHFFVFHHCPTSQNCEIGRLGFSHVLPALYFHFVNSEKEEVNRKQEEQHRLFQELFLCQGHLKERNQQVAMRKYPTANHIPKRALHFHKISHFWMKIL